MIGDWLPTRRSDWRRIATVTRRVLTRPSGVTVAVLVAAIALSAFVLGQQLDFVTDVLQLPWLSPRERLTILLEQYPVVGPRYDPLRGWLLVTISAQVGLTAAIGVHALRQNGLGSGDGVTGTLGIVFGAAGAGCAACGPTALAGLLSAVGLTGVLSALPLQGVEFLLVAALAMTVSLHRTAAALAPAECAVGT